jgi:16S rRNA (guanine527-N7)-methyltransferase
LPAPDEAFNSLGAYLDLLIRWNDRINLYSRKFESNDLARLMLSSLIYIPLVMLDDKTLLDVGSGAGLPGLITELTFPNKLKHTTLTEPRRWRRLFLEDVAKKLKITDRFTIIQDRVEKVTGQFDIITSRAVTSSEELLPILKPLLVSQGKVVLFGKGAPVIGWQQEDYMIELPRCVGGVQCVRVIKKV